MQLRVRQIIYYLATIDGGLYGEYRGVCIPAPAQEGAALLAEKLNKNRILAQRGELQAPYPETWLTKPVGAYGFLGAMLDDWEKGGQEGL